MATTRARYAGITIRAVLACTLLTIGLAGSAAAAANVTQAEITGTRLTIAGTAFPSKNITVDGVRMGRSDARGTFRITRDPFTAPADCMVDVNDGSRVPTVARLTGCTVSPSTNLVFLTPERLPDAVVGEPYLAWIVVDDLPGPSDYRFSLVSGKLPAGSTFSGNTLPARPEARVTGTPKTVGTSTFTIQASDAVTGLTARRTFTVTVLATPGLAIPSGVNVLDPTVVGADYSGVLAVSGGGPLKTWVLTAGSLPPGLALGIGIVWGVPTTAGTYTFTVRVTDNLGASATGQYSVTVAAG